MRYEEMVVVSSVELLALALGPGARNEYERLVKSSSRTIDVKPEEGWWIFHLFGGSGGSGGGCDGGGEPVSLLMLPEYDGRASHIGREVVSSDERECTNGPVWISIGDM